MWLRFPLDDILSSKTKVSVLRALVLSPTGLTGRELARATGLGQSNVSLALKQLVAAGIVEARVVRPALEYRVRTDDEPLLKSLRELFRTEKDRLPHIVSELTTRVPDLLSLILFGSQARGTQHSGSDADLLVIVEHNNPQVEQQIADICQDINESRLSSLFCIVRDREQIGEWTAEQHPLWETIRDDHIVLAGSSVAELVR